MHSHTCIWSIESLISMNVFFEIMKTLLIKSFMMIQFCSFCSELNEKFSILDHDLHWVFCDVYDSFNYFILNQHVWDNILKDNVNWWTSVIQNDFKFHDVVTVYWKKFDIVVKLYAEFSFLQSIWCIKLLLQRNASSLSEVIVNYL